MSEPADTRPATGAAGGEHTNGAPTRKPPADQAVRDAIRTRLDRNMCVEAGAGTGKTTSLVARIVELIASGTAAVDELAVITFTEKAAAELSSRVREAIEDALRDERNEGRRERLVEGARSLYRGRMETIHTFAASLLRERPVEARLDPEFAIMGDLEAKLAFDSAYEDWLGELMEGDHPEVERALNLGFGLDELRQAAEIVNARRFLLPLQPFQLPEPDVERLSRWLRSNAGELRGVEGRCNDEEDKGLPGLRELIEFAELFESEGTTVAARERLVVRASAHPKRNAGSQAHWDDPADCVRMKELVCEYLDLRDELETGLRAKALLGVLPHVERFVDEFEATRRAQAKAGYDDLLIWARDLLRDRPEVRRYYQRRFRALLIDEFQDTDPIQVEIAAYLTSDGQEGTDWRSLRPAPGKLFVVGDPKQSIYRFRRADIAIYDEVKRHALADDLEEIVQNFRSLPGVISWVNRAFDKLFEEVEGLQPANVPLEPMDVDLGLERPPVVVLRGGGDDLDAEGVRRHEARAVARLIARAVEVERWPVRDPVSGLVREPQWRDVAILLPARTGLEAFEEELAAVGIPHRHEGSRDYFQRQEVRELIAILRSVDDPTDRLSLMGALRSSAFGCSDQDVVLHLAGGGARDYRVNGANGRGDSEAVAEAFRALKSWHRARARLSVPELVQLVVEESRLVEVALMHPDGPQAAANLLAIVDQARAFSAAAGGGLRRFTRWLQESTENESPEVDAEVAEEADDVVRILTMHGAKGLEFPIVVTAGLASAGRTQCEPVPDEPERRLHFRVGTKNKSGYFATLGYKERWEAEKAALEAERIRLLYVATTRARDHLIVPAFRGKGKPGPYLQALQTVLPEGGEHGEVRGGVWLLDADQLPEVGMDEAARVDGDGRIVAGAADGASAARPTVEQVLAERERWDEEHASLIRSARKEIAITVASSVERSVRPLAAEASHSESTLLVSEGPPLPVGDALHLVMERLSLPGAEDLDEVVDSVCAEAALLDRRDEVLEMARRCLASPTVRQAIESGRYRREIPFTVPHDGGFATGRVDLVFPDGDELVVVDYKSDDVPAELCEEHAREKYSGQVETYAEALGWATGMPVGRVVLVFARVGVDLAMTAARQSLQPGAGGAT